MTPALTWLQVNISAARTTWAPGCGSRQGRQWISRSIACAQAPVPGGVELDLVDAVAVAVVRAQDRLVALGAVGVGDAPPGVPASAPVSRRRSTPQPPPSRSSASCSARSASKVLYGSSGGAWLVTSWVPRAVLDAHRARLLSGVRVGVGRASRHSCTSVATSASWPVRPLSASPSGPTSASPSAPTSAAATMRSSWGRSSPVGDAVGEHGGEGVAVAAAQAQPLLLQAQPGGLALGAGGRVDGLGDQRVGDRRGGQRAAAERLDGGGDALAGRAAVGGRDLDHDRQLALGGAPEDLGEQLGLGGEVAVDGPDRHAGAGRGLLDARGREAAGGDAVERARRRSARGSRPCGPRSWRSAGRP